MPFARPAPLPQPLRRRSFLGRCALLGLGALGACERLGAATTDPALPRLGTVGPFWLTDQDGRTFSEQSCAGKIWVAAFMFTRCPTICPEMTRRMQHLQERARARRLPLELVSFSVDPDNDTPEVLQRYVREHHLDASNWRFVTGDSATIRAAAETGFKIGVDGKADPAAPNYGITHGTHLVLLDVHHTIRGYYQSTDPGRVEQLLDDAGRLAKEA